MPIKYNQQLKADVLAFYAANPSITKRQICKDFGINYKTFFNWLREEKPTQGAAGGVTGISTTEKERQQQKRILLLEQENLILRKAAALFAQEVAPKGNTLSS